MRERFGVELSPGPRRMVVLDHTTATHLFGRSGGGGATPMPYDARVCFAPSPGVVVTPRAWLTGKIKL